MRTTCEQRNERERWGYLERTTKRSAKSVDEDLKLMMILRSQEVGLKIKTDNDEENVTCWTGGMMIK